MQGLFDYLFDRNKNSAKEILPKLTTKNLENQQEQAQEIKVIDTGSSLEIGNGLTVYYEPDFMEIVENQTLFCPYLNSTNQRSISLNFMPTTPTEKELTCKAKLSEQALVIRDFSQAMLTLIDILETNTNFQDVVYIRGNTDKDMINFCQKIGFHRLNDFPSIIYTTKQSLCQNSNKDILKAKLEQANKILKKRKT